MDDFVATVEKLASIYCPYVLKPVNYGDGKEKITVLREIQTDVMPPKSNYLTGSENDLFMTASQDLHRLPEDWEEQQKKTGETFLLY